MVSVYHFHVKTISRTGVSVGMSAVGAASYRSGTAIKNERDGMTYDYTKKRGVVFSEILSPIGSPDWTRDRSALWNAVEKHEKRRDARLAREVEVALPVELERDKQLNLVREFARLEFVTLGMVADVCVHDKGDGNPHAHILLTDRSVCEHGFDSKKDTSWNSRDLLLQWRKSWETHVNFALERCGIDVKVSCKSLAEQGVDRVPQIHVGPKDAHDSGHEARRVRNEDIKALNVTRTELADFDKEIAELEKQIEVIKRAAEVGKAASIGEVEPMGHDRVGGREQFAVVVPVSPETSSPFTKMIPARDKRIQQIAKRVRKEQEDLRAKYEAAYANFKELEAMEPRGLGELFGESKKHKDWRERRNSAASDVMRIWEARGGDLDAPDEGASEIQRRLASGYARAEAERIIADEERRKRLEEHRAQKSKEEHAKLEEARAKAKLKDTVLVEVEREVSCHVEGVKGVLLTGTILRIDDDSGKIEIRCGGRKLMFSREKVYFTEVDLQGRSYQANTEHDKRLCDHEQDLGR